jgi:hypothetical protein
MKKIIFLFLLVISFSTEAQLLRFKNKEHDDLYGRAWKLALWTIDTNTTDKGLLKAGAGYGGEWARDASMNSWNAASLLRPNVAEYTLWSVTRNRDTVAHQYWDKIVWVIAAWNHFCITRDLNFLRKALRCSENTLRELKYTAYNPQFGLFTGPGNINDGIAAYPEPVFEPGNMSSYVLDHKKSKDIMVLSTNLLYWKAIESIAKMHTALATGNDREYWIEELDMHNRIKNLFYDGVNNRLAYFIYPNGEKVWMQEGLGYSYALLFNLLDDQQSLSLIKNTRLTNFGIANVYPHFPRYNDSMPGRHNLMVWAFINAYWAHAMSRLKQPNELLFEMNNQSRLALDPDKGNGNFEEVANALTGKPDGGWQSNRQWSSKDHQTWNATGFCRMIINGLFGLRFEADAIYIEPCMPAGLGSVTLWGLKYRNTRLNITITGKGTRVRKIFLNGKKLDKPLITTLAPNINDINVVMRD